MKTILVTHQLPKVAFETIVNDYKIIMPDKGLISSCMLDRWIGRCDALLPTYAFKVTKEIIDRATNLEIIANFGAGYDNIDVNYAITKGILVTNSPKPVIEPTAELAFSLLLNVARRISECDRKLGSSGIVGMGAIGQALARRASACGMRIIYYNRKRLSQEIENAYEADWVSLNELLATSDFISLHAPATSETYHMIDIQQFNLMKPSVVLINTARGNLINERVLIHFLQKKRIFGAGLDVFENEPEIPSELLLLDNVLLSPHNGTGTIDTRVESTRYALQNIINYFEGKTLLSPVTK